MIDHLVHYSDAINLQGDSYRLKSPRVRQRSDPRGSRGGRMTAQREGQFHPDGRALHLQLTLTRERELKSDV